jgi:(1->4)-alpha-D-glucan 1-alpha-D-glucosylmutase
MLSGLSQTLLKITSPGVPDFYQGAELWDLRLVDPDNRGPIDFEMRRDLLAGVCATCASVAGEDAEAMVTSWRDGRIKLHVVSRSLEFSRRQQDLIHEGDYLPLRAKGPQSERIIAFARRHGGNWVITVTPRCVASVQAPITGAEARRKFWDGSELVLPEDAPNTWRNIFATRDATVIQVADRRLDLGKVFDGFPVALLVPAGAKPAESS